MLSYLSLFYRFTYGSELQKLGFFSEQELDMHHKLEGGSVVSGNTKKKISDILNKSNSKKVNAIEQVKSHTKNRVSAILNEPIKIKHSALKDEEINKTKAHLKLLKERIIKSNRTHRIK